MRSICVCHSDFNLPYVLCNELNNGRSIINGNATKSLKPIGNGSQDSSAVDK